MMMRNYSLTVGTVAATTAQFATTSELLDRAYRLVGSSSSCALIDFWWDGIWPSIQRIESKLRAGAPGGDARDESELARLVLLFEKMQVMA